MDLFLKKGWGSVVGSATSIFERVGCVEERKVLGI